MKSRDSVPWRVRSYTFGETVLTVAQLDRLSEAHDLDRDDLDRMAGALADALDQRRSVMREDVLLAREERGRREVKAAIAEIGAAERKLAAARERLNGLSFQHASPGTGARNPAVDRIETLSRAINAIGETRAYLEIAERENKVVYRDIADKRTARDERRRMVCKALFDFWIESGRRLSYTTDPVANDRKGPLMRFVYDVVAFVTEPPSALSGEAVKVEIEDYRAARGSGEPAGPLRTMRDVDAESAHLIAKLDAMSTEPAARALALGVLVATCARRGAEGRAVDLRIAVRLTAVLVSRAEGPVERGMALTEHALALTALGERHWDYDTLDEAARIHREAVATLPRESHPSAWAGAQMNCARTMQIIAALRDDPELLDGAVAGYRAALEVLDPTTDAALWFGVKTSLGIALAGRGGVEDLQGAVACLSEALDMAPREDEPRLRATVQYNLAVAMFSLATQTKDQRLLALAALHADDAAQPLDDDEAAEIIVMAEKLRREVAQSWSKLIAS